MAYAPPLSERIRIQFEIIGENIADCLSSISHNYKKPVLLLCGIGVLLTVRSARRGVRSAKIGGYGSYSSDDDSTSYGTYGSSTSTYGGSSLGTGGYGGTNSLYSSSSLGGSTTMGGAAMGAGSYRSPIGGAGVAMGGGMGVSGKSTGSLADSHGNQIMTLDPSIHFYDYGSSSSFSGIIETIQAYDSPTYVSQVLNQPNGHGKVLVIDGGGIGQSTGAVLDSVMAAAALRNGWKGVIVHGLVRDADQLARMQIGIKALGTSPVKGKAAMGQKGMALQIGNSQLQPGWWVYADKDGCIFSQQDISGGSFGGSGGGMITSNLSGGIGGYGSTSTVGNTLGSGAMAGGIRGGYGATSLGGGYGSTVQTTSGGTTNYGGVGSASSPTYGGSTYGGTTGYGGLGSASSSTTYGSSTYAGHGGTYRSYTSKRRKNKVIKLVLASAIAGVVWLLCLS